MNKRFSTLLAGVALLGAMNANAEVNSDIKLQEGKNAGLYQLAVDGGVLSVNENGELVVVDKADNDNLTSTLWCVTVAVEDQGQTPKYDFLNRGTGAYLDITMDEFVAPATTTETAPVLGGEIGGWAFSNIFATGVEEEKPLFSYFKNDSVVGFVLTKGNITLKKEAADKIAGANFMTVSLQEADAITLNAEQINTKLGQQKANAGVKLTFKPDRNNTTLENPFSDVAFLATDTMIGEVNFVNITKKSNGDALYVDTAYTNVNGAKFLAFNYVQKKGSHASALDSLKSDEFLKSQGAFLFTYFPSKDSLVIQVNQVVYEAGEDGTFATGDPKTCATNEEDSCFVTVQDLIKQDQIRIVTIRDVKETDITIGFSGCEASETDKTTLSDGVYTIKNAKGQYLAIPLNSDCADGEYFAGWVTVDADDQDVTHMPAYQWVITKNKTSEYAAPTSALTIVNREYPELNSKNVQLYKAEDGSIYVETLDVENSNNGLINLALRSGELAETSPVTLVFTELTGDAISDPKLGYRYMSAEELLISNYAFNYFNALSENNYVDVLAGDSVLNVLNDSQAFFGIDSIADNSSLPYGIDVTDELVARIPGLAQLNRTPYQIYTTDANGKKAYVGYQNDRVFGNMDERVVASSNLDMPSPFYFKENNHVYGKHYYALVLSNPNDSYNPDCIKVGVADQSSKAFLQFQCGCENRTSSFAIGISEEPLYRRFNSMLLEGNEGDAADTLRFVEKYRNEYLQMEANENFMIDGINFLGIDAVNKGEGKSFFVDSVWVTRGLGYIKPQYLVSIDREAAQTTTIKIPCPLCQAEIAAGHDAPENCIHDKYVDVEGYERGKYLVNFADSTNNAYKWGKYSRVGFVDALHIGDSLYLLIDKFAGVKTEDVSIADIIAANTAKGHIVDGSGYYVKNLTGDTHKYYTWSFRFIDPSAAAEEVEASRSFLFESMALNGVPQIAPENASWLKMQNGCLVMSDETVSQFKNAKTGGDDALIFNIEQGSKDDVATDNEVIAVEGVSVIAGNGNVQVAGAQGKKVVITNILGQTVANTVIASDNATIAVPAGMVVVAVEGEDAVKAIVK